MGLYRREGSNQWWYRFRFQGREVRASTGTADKETAEQAEAHRKRELWEHARLGVKPEHDWEDALLEYLAVMPDGRNKKFTQAILRWATPHLTGKKLSHIDRDVLTAVRNTKVADINRSKAASAARGVPSRWPTAQPSSVNRALGVIGAVLHAAHDRGWCPLVRMPLLKVPKKEPVWATRERVMQLIHGLPKHQIPMVIYDLEVGWRRHNVTHLQWPQVDLDRRFAWVTPEAAKARAGIPAPLSDIAVEVLKGQLGKHDLWVFPYRGRPITATSTRAYRRARDAAGLPPTFTWHALRHTWASWHRQGKTPMHVLKELGGWKDDRMPAGYAHLSADHLAPFVEQHKTLDVGAVRAALGTKTGTGQEVRPEKAA